MSEIREPRDWSTAGGSIPALSAAPARPAHLATRPTIATDRVTGSHEVEGSIPFSSTDKSPIIPTTYKLATSTSLSPLAHF